MHHYSLPTLTAFFLAVGGILGIVSCLLSRVSEKLGVPIALLFLIVGMLAGSEGVGGIYFDSYSTAYTIGTLALVIILFAGGLSTHLAHLPSSIGPATVLATVGVVGVCGITAAGARLFGMSWGEALLFGAIVSSTDAASVFAALRGVRLKGRIGQVIELESGLNDPMAIILAVMMTANLMGTGTISWHAIPSLLYQLAVGGSIGVIVGYFAVVILKRTPISNASLYPIFTLCFALVAYGLSTFIDASGFMAVYLAGIAIGSGKLPYQSNINRVCDSLAWLAQVTMFLMLGLLIFPKELPGVAFRGMTLAFFVAFVARPISVFICLLPFRFNWRESLCIAWLGLRGAVPIIIAIGPILEAKPGSSEMASAIHLFNVVFFVVVVGSIIPGTTVHWFVRKFNLLEATDPEPAMAVDISAGVPLDAMQLTIYVRADSKVAGRSIAELNLPSDSVVMLLLRGKKMIAPRGQTLLTPGDHAYLFCPPEAESKIRALFEQDAPAAQ